MLGNRSLWAAGLAVLCALALMGLPQPHKQAVAARARAGVLAASQWAFARVIRYARNEQKSRFLLRENVQLALENMSLREAQEENARLRRALDFRRAAGELDVVPAAVIGRDPDQLNDTAVIDAGENRGIGTDWPVITAAGLVGHVSEVGPNSSVVQLLMRSPVSALTQEGRAQGVVSWVRDNTFQLRFVDASSKIERGDRVVSSGLGGRYPKGIPIGTVTQVNELERDPLFQQVLLESHVDFLRLEEVFVIRPASP